MGEPMTKDRFLSYLSLKAETKCLCERIAQMEHEAGFPPKKEGTGSQHQPGTGDRMERAVIRLMEEKAKLAANEKEMAVIERAIDGLKDSLERDVMTERYLFGHGRRHRTWMEVGALIYGEEEEKNRLAALRVHKQVIERFEANETLKARREKADAEQKEGADHE